MQMVVAMCRLIFKLPHREENLTVPPKSHWVHFSEMVVFFPVMVNLNLILYFMKTNIVVYYKSQFHIFPSFFQ